MDLPVIYEKINDKNDENKINPSLPRMVKSTLQIRFIQAFHNDNNIENLR